jgi:hypothetical protein
MSTPHRATEEQWEVVEICREEGHTPWPTATCLLELRARVEVLERRCEVQLQQLSDLQDRHHRLAGSVRLLEGEVVTDQPEPAPATEESSAVAPLLWVLWHHLGANSPVGQPIREYLGMGQFEPMSKEQVESAKRWKSIPLKTPSFNWLRREASPGRQHGAQSAEPPPAPPWWGDGQPQCSSSLVDEVAECITPSGEPLRRGWACDAITSAADWLEKRGNIGSAEDLRKEAAAWLEAEPET